MVFTFPLIKNLTTGLPYTHYPEKKIEVRPPIQGDYLQLYYVMWVVKDSLWGPTPFLRDPYQFNVPGIEAPRFSLQELPKSLLYSLLAVASTDIAGYNLLILVTFALSGLGLFLLAEALTGSAWAGLLGGTLYSLFPYRVIHRPGRASGRVRRPVDPLDPLFFPFGLSSPKGGLGPGRRLLFPGPGVGRYEYGLLRPAFFGPLSGAVLVLAGRPARYRRATCPARGAGPLYLSSEGEIDSSPAQTVDRPGRSVNAAFFLAAFSEGPAIGSVGYRRGAPSLGHPGLLPPVAGPADPLS